MDLTIALAKSDMRINVTLVEMKIFADGKCRNPNTCGGSVQQECQKEITVSMLTGKTWEDEEHQVKSFVLE